MSSSMAKIVYPSLDIRANPYPVHELLRTEAPVYNVPGRDDYVISRHRDVVHVLDRPALFSSAFTRHPDKKGRRPDVLESDPPEHKARRALCFASLKPGRLHAHLDKIQDLVDGLIDDFISDGSVEFVGQFVTPLPVRVLAMVFGLSFDELWQIHSEAPFVGTARTYLDDEEQRSDLRRSLRQYEWLGEQLRDRFESPRDDLLTEMIHRQIARDGAVDLKYLQAEVDELLIGGLHTTAYLMTNAMRLLAEHPDQRRRLRDEPALIGRMLEETIRLESPVQWVPRVTTERTTVAGTEIPAGASVLVLLAAANRDPEVFADPERFDVDRPDAKDHVGWGRGIHFCLGAPLARHEARIAFERLLSRLGEFWLTPGRNAFEPVASPAHVSVQALHLSFSAGPVRR